MSKEKIIELEELVKPVVEYLRKNFNPHSSIIINWDNVRVVSDIIGTSIKDDFNEEGWISVDDELPEYGARVFVHTDENEKIKAVYMGNFYDEDNLDLLDVDYWKNIY